ncbi:MAG: hypothetical protein ACHREM_14525 [Polyangiales bacterium]
MRFSHAKSDPRGVIWFGVHSFWGHLQHFIASAIATEDIDSRDWMHPDDPHKLVEQVASHLRGDSLRPPDHPRPRRSLCEAIERDLWIDYVADTGDDVTASEAVASLVMRSYMLPDPRIAGEEVVGARGDILFFGGDTAYPVATANEILARVVVPFNRAIAKNPGPAGVHRAILGIPGNHDWYDGLDGFARLVRRRVGQISAEELQPETEIEHRTRISHAREFVERFVLAGRIHKRKALVIDGYETMQHASYFALPLAPGLDMLAVDRQLRTLDFRQRRYFARFRAENASSHTSPRTMLMLPDPVYAFLEDSPSGVAMIKSLELDLTRDPHLVISGDIHHYQRRPIGESLHVVAGGGGAFLHPARIPQDIEPVPIVEWPGHIASRALLRRVPFHVAFGGAGFIPHLALVAIFGPALAIGVTWWSARSSMILAASLSAGIIGAVCSAFLGGIRKRRGKRAWQIALLATLAGVAMGLGPTIVDGVVVLAFARFGIDVAAKWQAMLVVILAAFFGAGVFGVYLATLTRFGLESTQAFTALGFPGFRHFLRIRIRADGGGVDVWCIGLEDPTKSSDDPILVDAFTWTGAPKTSPRSEP